MDHNTDKHYNDRNRMRGNFIRNQDPSDRKFYDAIAKEKRKKKKSKIN